MRQKPRLSVDSLNRLVIRRGAQSVIPDGRWGIDGKNAPFYSVTESPRWRREQRIPEKISFNGIWRLNSHHEPEFVLALVNRKSQGETLEFRSKNVFADKNAFVFEIATTDKRNSQQFQLLKLAGCWQADENNRITFEVTRKTKPDILTLQGEWFVNNNQQIVYVYESRFLKKRTLHSSTLVFKGFWRIDCAHKLTYQILGSSNSFFEFKTALETPNVYPQEGAVKYRLGVGVKESAKTEKVITLFGSWKIQRNLSLSFEMNYGSGVVRSTEFLATMRLTPSDEIIFELTNKQDEPLGLNVVFTHRVLKYKYAHAFVHLEKFLNNARIEGGFAMPF